MGAFLQKIRDAVDGKKTIITAVIGILTAALAWAGGELTDWQAITAVWLALQIIFIRTGNKKDVANRVDVVNVEAFRDAYDAGAEDAESHYETGFYDGYEQGDENARYEDEG